MALKLNAYPIDTASDLSPTWGSTTLADFELSLTDPNSVQTKSYSIPASATRSLGFITPSGEPNSDDFTDSASNWVITERVTTATDVMDLRFRVQVHRLNSSGTIQESSGYGSYFTLTAGSSDNIDLDVNHTFSTGNCSDRFAVEVEVENTNTMKSVDLEWRLNDATYNDWAWNTEQFDYDTSTCTGGSTFVPKCVMF